MHYLNTSYAAYFNTKYRRAGPLYQGRFKAILVQQDEYLHYLSCYIHLNPQRASIVKSPQDYPYSSYNLFISKKEPPQWLNIALILSMFTKTRSKAKRLYRQFVQDNIGKEKDFINNNTKKGFILGSEDFFDHIRAKFIDKEDPELPLLREMRSTKEPALIDIKSIVERNITKDNRLRRSTAIYLSRKYTQKTLREIAAFYGKITYPGVSQAYRRMETRRGKDKRLTRLLPKLEIEIMKCKM